MTCIEMACKHFATNDDVDETNITTTCNVHAKPGIKGNSMVLGNMSLTWLTGSVAHRSTCMARDKKLSQNLPVDAGEPGVDA